MHTGVIVFVVRVTADAILEDVLGVRTRRTEALEDRLGTLEHLLKNKWIS